MTHPGRAPAEELPLTRPSTPLGWAPPYTDTPGEITGRRAVLLAATRRADRGRTHRTSRSVWDDAIRAALADLTDTEPTTEPKETP